MLTPAEASKLTGQKAAATRPAKTLERQLARATDPSPSPLDLAIQTQQMENILTAIDTLTPRESAVFKARNGLVDGVERTLVEVGEMYGLTRERIRQIEARAERKLRWRLTPDGDLTDLVRRLAEPETAVTRPNFVNGKEPFTKQATMLKTYGPLLIDKLDNKGAGSLELLWEKLHAGHSRKFAGETLARFSEGKQLVQGGRLNEHADAIAEITGLPLETAFAHHRQYAAKKAGSARTHVLRKFGPDPLLQGIRS